MKDNLKAIVKSALEELRQNNVSDISVKKSLVGFAESYNSVSADEQRICYDTAVEEFLEEVFGRESDSFKIYWKDYEAAKKGEMRIEP